MSTFSQFAGGGATKAVINAFSSGGVSAAGISNSVAGNSARSVLSGALTANTLATVVNITTGGQIPFLVAYTNDATARTIRLVIVCDGVTVFDATTNSIAANGTGLAAAGGAAGSGLVDGGSIRFNASCLIRVASSLTETDKITVGYKLY